MCVLSMATSILQQPTGAVSCDRNLRSCKAKTVYYLAVYRRNLPIPDIPYFWDLKSAENLKVSKNIKCHWSALPKGTLMNNFHLNYISKKTCLSSKCSFNFIIVIFLADWVNDCVHSRDDFLVCGLHWTLINPSGYRGTLICCWTLDVVFQNILFPIHSYILL